MGINTSKATIVIDNYSTNYLKNKVKSRFILPPCEAVTYKL
jgi:hypothetical protein